MEEKRRSRQGGVGRIEQRRMGRWWHGMGEGMTWARSASAARNVIVARAGSTWRGASRGTTACGVRRHAAGGGGAGEMDELCTKYLTTNKGLLRV